jgi:hypothetical protein
MTKRTRRVLGAVAAVLVVLGIVAMAQGGLGAKGQGVSAAAQSPSGTCMGARANVGPGAAEGMPGACVGTCRTNPNAVGNGVVGSRCDMGEGGSCGSTESGDVPCSGPSNASVPTGRGCGMMR